MSHLSPEEVETLAASAAPASGHTAECAECTKAVARARGRQKLLKGMTPYTLSDVAFSRVDAKLQEQVREGIAKPAFGWRWLGLGIAAAAAIAFAVVSVQKTTVAPAPVQVAVADAHFEPLTVLLARGSNVKAGAVLERGAKVSGSVVLATADGASRFEAFGGATLGTPQASVMLGVGSVSADVHGGPWVFQLGQRWVKTSDAALTLTKSAAEVLVVSRGTVLVSDDAAFSNPRKVEAPAAVDLASGKPVSADGKDVSAVPAKPWATLELGFTSDSVELDGQQIGGSPVSLLTGLGKHKLRSQGREVEIDVGSMGMTLGELPAKPVAVPSGPVVEADPNAIALAIKAQLPKLRVCHEKWLKVDPTARGKVTMALTVSPKGKVTRTQFSSAEGVPDAVSECLGRAARAMKLPMSSEEVELELPVVLGAP